ncbi:hypothetical protein DER30_4024 [Streptomyces sp. HB202]|nr:hypothetical protein DER30_4024 [Streptomyces sp. HB202]
MGRGWAVWADSAARAGTGMPGRFAVQSVGGPLSSPRLAGASRSTAISSDVCFPYPNLHRTAQWTPARSGERGVCEGSPGPIGAGVRWVSGRNRFGASVGPSSVLPGLVPGRGGPPRCRCPAPGR